MSKGFLLQAMQSKKVVLVGEHSKGELDYANVNYLESPDGKLLLGCPTSRSRRLPSMPIDNIGIQPDIILTPETNWIAWVTEKLHEGELQSESYRGNRRSVKSTDEDGKKIKDTSAIDIRQLAQSIISDSSTSTTDRVKKIVGWTNRNFEWTYTDYQKRTVKEIIVRGGGNRSEQTRVTRALLTQLGIKTRSVYEINIQPDDTARQRRAEAKVMEIGNRLSVFGLNHNDHVWIEYWDEQSEEWKPADATLGLVGVEDWLVARVGFGARKIHAILPSRDMLVPIAVFAKDDKSGEVIEDRTHVYLIDELNRMYGGRMEKLHEWTLWTELIDDICMRCREAFEGKAILHEWTVEISQIRTVYESLKRQME